MRIITYYIYLQNDCRFFTYESCYSSFLLLLVHQNKTLNPSNPSLWFSPSSLMNDARDTMNTFTTMCLLLVLVSKHIQTMKKITVKEIELVWDASQHFIGLACMSYLYTCIYTSSLNVLSKIQKNRNNQSNLYNKIIW